MKKVSLYVSSIRHLRFSQIWYLIYYRCRPQRGKIRIDGSAPGRPVRLLKLGDCIPARKTYEKGRFCFLNLSKDFSGVVDWNCAEFGKLWTYNLNYFDFLNQPGLDTEEGLGLMRGFIDRIGENRAGLEPYPVSVRIRNWVKFISSRGIDDRRLDAALYSQTRLLLRSLEYHLLGNHLLENGFALLFSAYYFRQNVWYRAAEKILAAELAEQVLDDGGHFERSPLYHGLMLVGILDCVNLMRHNPEFSPVLLPLLEEKASLMLGWLQQIIFKNGDMPLVNDSSGKMAPDVKEIFVYAASLGIKPKPIPLSGSGYRRVKKERYEILVDAGEIGPDYQPAHAHSDTFSFLLYISGSPFIVDTGVSTYARSPLRQKQRGTAAHNTVQVDGMEQSEVWSSFRVGRRAHVHDLREEEFELSAWHDGYACIGVKCRRIFGFGDDFVVITDRIDSRGQHRGSAFLHFYPGITVESEENAVVAGGKRITFTGAERIITGSYGYAPEFNKEIPAVMVQVDFKGSLTTRITI